MKDILLIISLIFFAAGVSAQEIIQVPSKGKEILKTQDDFSGFRAVFSFDEMRNTTVEDDEFGAFSQIAIDGAFPTGDVGTPALPVFKKMIAVPAGATPKVVVRNFAEQTVDLNERGGHRIFPVQPSILQGEEEAQKPIVLNETAYSENEYTRSSMANISVLGTMRGVRIAMLTVHPVRYNPVADALLIYNDIDVEVIFENGDYAATQSLYQSTYSPYFATPYSYFYNKGVYEEHPDLYKTPVHMLVVADRMFSAALQPWVAWKTKKGFYVEVGYTDEIGTTAAEIQTFCHQKYNAGVSAGKTPTFLVVVGDVEQVPASADGTATGHVTDLYYASVDGDYFPEMYYSRMSAQTEEQLENYLDKVLFYEQYQFADPTKLNRALIIAGIDGAWNLLMGRHQANYFVENYITNGDMIVYGDFTQYPYWAWQQHISNAGGFINYSGFCMDDYWSYPEYNVEDAYYYKTLYPLTFANCGSSANFGYGESLGEAFIRVKEKGAIAYVGSSAPTFWNENFHFAVGAYADVGNGIIPPKENTTMGYYDAMFVEDGFHSVASHVFAGNLAVTYAVENGYPIENISENNAQYYWEAYHVLGDASVTPYFREGEENPVSHLPKFAMDSNAFEIEAAPGSYAALSKDDVLYATAVADDNGKATLVLENPISSFGNVDIVVTKPSYKPYIQSIPVIPSSGPYIVYDSYKVAGVSGLTYCSTDEKVTLTLQNIGNEPIGSNWTVTIACDDPQITIHTAQITYASIGVDEKRSGIFNVTVAHDIENEKVFDLNVTAKSGSQTWTFTVPVVAYAPVFTLEKVMVNRIENQPLTPGTTALLTAVVRNNGGAKTYHTEGFINNDDLYVSIFCEEQSQAKGTIAPNESVHFEFAVEVSGDMPADHLSELLLFVAGEYDFQYQTPLTIDYKLEYDAPGATNCASEDAFKWIWMQNLNNRDETCYPAGYSDYTDSIIQVKVGMSDLPYECYCKMNDNYFHAWADWNGNKIFEDHERITTYDVTDCRVDHVSYGGNIKFDVPSDAVPGIHRIRFRTRQGRVPTGPYDEWTNGQTHDYSIEVLERFPRAKNLTAASDGNAVALTWEAPEDMNPAQYRIYRNGIFLKSVDKETFTYTDRFLSSGLYIYDIVASYSGGGTSLKIAANPVCIDAGYEYECNPPVNLRAETNNIQGAIAITWDDAPVIDNQLLGYYIYRNDEKMNTELITENRYEDKKLTVGEYIYYVTAVYNSCVESLPSESITVDLVVGINEITSVDYRLYPNPANNQVTIKGEGLYRVELYNLQGRKVGDYQNIQDEITLTDLSKYANGVYLVRLYSRQGHPVTKRLVLMK